VHVYIERPHIAIDFSNILSKASIERLAEVDEYEVVREVQVGVPNHLCAWYSLM
jgi:hypothetical protein